MNCVLDHAEGLHRSLYSRDWRKKPAPRHVHQAISSLRGRMTRTVPQRAPSFKLTIAAAAKDPAHLAIPGVHWKVLSPEMLHIAPPVTHCPNRRRESGSFA